MGLGGWLVRCLLGDVGRYIYVIRQKGFLSWKGSGNEKKTSVVVLHKENVVWVHVSQVYN